MRRVQPIGAGPRPVGAAPDLERGAPNLTLGSRRAQLPERDEISRIEQSSGALATHSLARMDEHLAWFAGCPPTSGRG